MSYIIVDDNVRTMTIPTDIVLLGVESDDDVNKIAFKMPRTYSGYDLSLFEVRINYMNANGEGDLYVVQDLTVDPEDQTQMTFTWIVGRTACKYKGNTKFIVCLKKFDVNNICIQEFNTTVYKLPVLEGLETTEAVVQENADVIEQILQMIDDSGMFDPNQYYTRQQIDELIPTKLPNPQKLQISGIDYDGSEAVIIQPGELEYIEQTRTGRFLNLTDVVPGMVKSIKMYDSEDQELDYKFVGYGNKNLFDVGSIAQVILVNNIRFFKNSDGTFKVNGNLSADIASVSQALDKSVFTNGFTYTLSTGKVVGSVSVRLRFTFTDSSTAEIVAKNSSVTFKLTKDVASCYEDIFVSGIGTVVNNEVICPQLEVGRWATTYIKSDTLYETITEGQLELPVLPEAISNIWGSEDDIAYIVVTYVADATMGKINEYADANLIPSQINGKMSVSYDGIGTVSIGVG